MQTINFVFLQSRANTVHKWTLGNYWPSSWRLCNYRPQNWTL